MKSRHLDTTEIEQLLHQAGLQATLQRIALCRYMFCESDHPTAEDVYNWADKNLDKVSQATVYNTLGKLVEVGLLKSFRFPHSEKVVYDHNISDHYHFLDEATGKIMDIDASEVKLSVDLPKKYKINEIEMVFKGTIKK